MPSEKMAGLVASAIVSDTVMFKSPTCTSQDRRMAARMARIANVPWSELGRSIFCLGLAKTGRWRICYLRISKNSTSPAISSASAKSPVWDSPHLLVRKRNFWQ